MVEFTLARSYQELEGILNLQAQNVEAALQSDEVDREGFVTVHHTMDILSKMNDPYPHIIAKDHERVIGYALVMLSKMGEDIPILVPMFKQIEQQVIHGKQLSPDDYFVMGQVCIAKGYRGMGIFPGMYHKMREEMSTFFPYVMTEVASRNKRSLRAHEKVGFKLLHTYRSPEGENWEIIYWDWAL